MREQVKLLYHSEEIKKAFSFIQEDDAHTFEQQMELARIPSYLNGEKERADYFKKLMEAEGYEARTDEVGNVYTRIKGTGKGPTVYISAHLDTVFPQETSLEGKWEGSVINLPGICDDTRGLAEILAILRAIKAEGLKPVGDIIIGGNVGEEGLGNLRGMKYFFSQNADEIDGFLSIDGVGPIICYGATGSHRYEVTFRGEGGHSYGAFGLVNPIHAMGRAISYISELRTPRFPKTTFSVGVVEGGTSVNAIASACKMLVDIRSDGNDELNDLDERIQECIKRAVEDENERWSEERAYEQEGMNGFNKDARISLSVQQIGERPAGNQERDCEIVSILSAAFEVLNVEPDYMSNGSTDANVPISMGIPAACVCGGGKGGKYHSLEEWFDPTDAYLGVQRNLLALLAMTGVEGTCEPCLKIRDRK